MIELLLKAWQFVIPYLEIALLWFAYYRLLRFIQRTAALQVVVALGLLVLCFLAAYALRLETISWIFSRIFGISVIALLIIFQPELRRGLAHLVEGRRWWSTVLMEEQLSQEIVRAIVTLSQKRIGALMAIEREVGLQPYIESGVVINGAVTAELLHTIFMPTTPLHDGGVIIRSGQVAAAGCLFPLSQNAHLSKTLGTRHRAAMGLTEETDALVLIVSEETGAISASIGGRLTRDLDEAALLRMLRGFGKSDAVEPTEVVST